MTGYWCLCDQLDWIIQDLIVVVFSKEWESPKGFFSTINIPVPLDFSGTQHQGYAKQTCTILHDFNYLCIGKLFGGRVKTFFGLMPV